jgi:hypothetical protein
MTRDHIYWMFVVMLCINGYNGFMAGIVLSAIPLSVYVLKRTTFSRLDTVIWAIMTLAAVISTIYSLFL